MGRLRENMMTSTHWAFGVGCRLCQHGHGCIFEFGGTFGVSIVMFRGGQQRIGDDCMKGQGLYGMTMPQMGKFSGLFQQHSQDHV